MSGTIGVEVNQFAEGRINQAEWAKEHRKSLGEQIDSNSKKTDLLRLNHQLDALARKVARGDVITGNERKFLVEKDAEKLHKAEMANHSKTVIEQRLKGADSAQDVEKILADARKEVESNTKHGDAAYGELLAEAVNEIVVDYAKEKEDNAHFLKYKTYNLKA